MSQIIKMGKITHNMVHAQTCEYCNTEFEYLHSELNHVTVKNNSLTLAVECPLCKMLLEPVGESKLVKV